MLKAYKYRIYPKQQALRIEKHFGCVWFVYNWALLHCTVNIVV